MQISALPMSALLYKLRDANTGFNQQLRNCANTYRIKPFSISFPEDIYSKSTKSFILGNFAIDDMEENGVVEDFRMAMYRLQSSNLNFEKMRDFSGIVPIALDTHIAFKSGNVDGANFETMGLAVEDAIAQVVQPYAVTSWGAGVVYNGGFACAPGPVQDAGTKNWRQVIAVRLTFQIDVG